MPHRLQAAAPAVTETPPDPTAGLLAVVAAKSGSALPLQAVSSPDLLGPLGKLTKY